jgi:ribosome biogenesis GTPase / thiamine phosphate phosphatase
MSICSWPFVYLEMTELATRIEKHWQHIREQQQRREMGGVPKRAPKAEKVRRRDWTEVYNEAPDAYDDLDLVDAERVVPKGEAEARKRRPAGSALHAGVGLAQIEPGNGAEAATDGTAEAAEGDTPRPGGLTRSQGIVIEVSTGLCRVRLAAASAEADRVLLCSLRPALRVPHSGFSNVVAAGDEVVVSHNGHANGIVDAVLPRRSALARPDVFYGHLQQVIVANVDQLLVVASWRDPSFWPELVDRYLLAAMRNNLAPIVCINKVDLAEERGPLEETAAALRRAGYHVILTSAVTGAGLNELRDVLHGRTTALAGLSGVGKSSLLSAAEPGLNLKVGEVNEHQHMGRHTTTQVSLHPLASGGFVADTPGIREMGLAGLRQPDLGKLYPEIAALAPRCGYANCSHTQEPGCAVKLAVRRGELSLMRYESYRKIWTDLPA